MRLRSRFHEARQYRLGWLRHVLCPQNVPSARFRVFNRRGDRGEELLLIAGPRSLDARFDEARGDSHPRAGVAHGPLDVRRNGGPVLGHRRDVELFGVVPHRAWELVIGNLVEQIQLALAIGDDDDLDVERLFQLEAADAHPSFLARHSKVVAERVEPPTKSIEVLEDDRSSVGSQKRVEIAEDRGVALVQTRLFAQTERFRRQVYEGLVGPLAAAMDCARDPHFVGPSLAREQQRTIASLALQGEVRLGMQRVVDVRERRDSPQADHVAVENRDRLADAYDRAETRRVVEAVVPKRVNVAARGHDDPASFVLLVGHELDPRIAALDPNRPIGRAQDAVRRAAILEEHDDPWHFRRVDARQYRFGGLVVGHRGSRIARGARNRRPHLPIRAGQCPMPPHSGHHPVAWRALARYNRTMSAQPTGIVDPEVRIVALSSQLPMTLRPAVRIDDDALFELCARNRDLRIERTAEGDLIVMPPTGGQTGRRNFLLTSRLAVWAERDGTGIGFDSSTGFVLPNGAERAPDLAWVRRDRWKALTAEQQRKFPPLCPDFVVELRSDSDRMADLQAKMQEWIDNGARLGFLIDPEAKKATVYRPNREPETFDSPTELRGDPELPGFVLSLDGIL